MTLHSNPDSTRIGGNIDRFTRTLVRFTPRDRLILSLICRGASDKEIAAHFGVQPKTARNHVLRLTRIAKVADDRQLVLYVMQQPQALYQGGEYLPGLHIAGTDDCPYCRFVREVA